MRTRTEHCPNCGASLDQQGICTNCGASVRGFYGELDLGRIDIARAVEQGLDYYLLLNIRPTASAAAIETAYWQARRSLPPTPDVRRMPPTLAQRLTLIEQAGYILRDPQRRQLYDRLHRERQARQQPTADDATRGIAAFRAGHFNDAARLLRRATHQSPHNEALHLSYALSLLYGSNNLASPEDWRVNEMRAALEQARSAGGDSPIARAHLTLCQAIDHYDKDNPDEGWRLLTTLTDALSDWYLPWIIGAYWKRREGDMGEVLARAERARRLQSDDYLVVHMSELLRRAWATAPGLLASAARRAAYLLADGTSASSLETVWR
jgi:curved DNA-binding protein CbpA